MYRREMETERLRWFIAVARTGGIRDAAAGLRLSPGTVSKAMTELESDMGQRLFVRSRRGFSLTEAGTFLRDQASQLLTVEREIREQLKLGATSRRLLVFGSEPLIALHMTELVRLAYQRFPDVLLQVRATRDDAATRTALSEEPASVGVVAEVGRVEAARALAAAPFGTYVGLGHPLARRAAEGVPVAEVQEHAFVVPEREVFGTMAEGASADGWRDDKFPRKKRLGGPTLALVFAYVEANHAIAYLPIKLAKDLRARRLKVTGCPYSCTCEASLVRAPAAPGWIRQLV